MAFEALSSQNSLTVRISSRGFNRKAVQSALRSIQYAVGKITKIPPNGLVIFASATELEMHEPPIPTHKSIYLCDSEFHREILDEMIRTSIIALLVVASGNGFGSYLIDTNGGIAEILIEQQIELPNSHRKGGQSSVRFDRLAEESRHNYIRKICEWLNSNKLNMPIILAGPANIKNEVEKSSILHTDLRKDICSIVTTRGEFVSGAKESLPQCMEILRDISERANRDKLDTFYQSLNEDSDLWIFGEDIQKALDLYLIDYMFVHESNELSDHELANVISSRGELAERFLKDFGGIVGKLYYPTDFQSWDEPEE